MRDTQIKISREILPNGLLYGLKKFISKLLQILQVEIHITKSHLVFPSAQEESCTHPSASSSAWVRGSGENPPAPGIPNVLLRWGHFALEIASEANRTRILSFSMVLLRLTINVLRPFSLYKIVLSLESLWRTRKVLYVLCVIYGLVIIEIVRT